MIKEDVVLNVNCSKCNKGKVIERALLNDDYNIACTECDYDVWMHYTGFDQILDAHDFNTQVGESVALLTNNGVWRHFKSHGDNAVITVQELLEGKKLIQKIETGEGDSYYHQNGGDFFLIEEDAVGRISEYQFVAKEDADMGALMAHFFGVKA